ncbi:putative dehydrogenase [Terriglobus roseus DSM 18391]|uniref:Putative dehydrogenase n=1 Tax=Terriglobus roseus (strain DSM 18391 / NRRL B-41598 / KBS 63) TaxID=926566 RepID=I3ZIL5_TERRK|nr:Gfo/Idh/MocA family oxidoreductase [Terriglobus roseus]AFL89083.1 putative dehydrogenase [Terriglobus roseus DSM 18391]
MKIGLIGYGFMGGAHAAAIGQIPGVTLAAVASRTRPSEDGPVRGNLDLKAGPLPDSVHWTPEWQEIVDDPTIDAIDICLPTHLHKQVIERAFANGKHVLCEKPMALTPADCAELLALAEKSGRTFMIAQVLRWMFPYQYAFEFVRTVGREDVTACTLQRSTGYPQWSQWLGKREVSGGAVLDLLSHDLDQALQWFGNPMTVSAISIGEVDTMRASMNYSGGLHVVVEGGWMQPEVAFSASFTIEAKDSKLTFADGKLHLTRNGETHEVEQPEQDAYFDEIAYFVQCCRKAELPTMCLPAESAKAVQLALLLEQSRDENGRELSWQ